MQPKHGDIVLIPIPFTDLSSQKQRPVVVISNDDYNHTSPDLVVVAMTSNPTLGPYSLPITSADLAQGKLNRPGTIRVDKIYTLDQQLTRRIFGRVNQTTLERITAPIQTLTTRAT
jgi:mRNA-degrading endonuclease toxin of MazEF toxin-antitoxin module